MLQVPPLTQVATRVATAVVPTASLLWVFAAVLAVHRNDRVWFWLARHRARAPRQPATFSDKITFRIPTTIVSPTPFLRTAAAILPVGWNVRPILDDDVITYHYQKAPICRKRF